MDSPYKTNPKCNGLFEDKCIDCQNTPLTCADEGKEFERWERVKSRNRFNTYFDTGLGREISSAREIDNICKEEGLVYGSDDEISAEARKNKNALEKRQEHKIEQELIGKISRII